MTFDIFWNPAQNSMTNRDFQGQNRSRDVFLSADTVASFNISDMFDSYRKKKVIFDKIIEEIMNKNLPASILIGSAASVMVTDLKEKMGDRGLNSVRIPYFFSHAQNKDPFIQKLVMIYIV